MSINQSEWLNKLRGEEAHTPESKKTNETKATPDTVSTSSSTSNSSPSSVRSDDASVTYNVLLGDQQNFVQDDIQAVRRLSFGSHGDIEEGTLQASAASFVPFEVQADVGRDGTEHGRRATSGAESDLRNIVDRIIRDVKLCLMSAVPAPDKTLELTSIVTPSGLHQLNQKTNAFELILNKEQLSEIGLDAFLQEAENLPEASQSPFYPYLTLEQLNKMERLVRAQGGFSVTGYTCIEEFWLRLVACGHFPPLPNHYARRFLDYIHKPIVQDAVLATRMMAHSAIIYRFVDEISFAGKQGGLVSAYEFTEDNALPLFTSLMGVGLLSFIFLRAYQDKEQAVKIMSRINLMLSTTIGFAENWDNYGSLVFSENMFLYILIPIVIVGMVRGFYRHEKDIPHVLDIKEFTLIKFLWYSLAYALTEGSLWSLGMVSPLNCIFIFKNMNDSDNLKAFYEDLDFIRYSVSFLTLFAQLVRHPALPIHYQVVGRYTSNIITATGEAFLDNAALSLLLGFAYCWIFGNNPSPNDIGQLTGYFAFQALFTIATFLVSFPITPELPEYKVIPTRNETVLSSLSSNSVSEISDRFEQRDLGKKNTRPRWYSQRFLKHETSTGAVVMEKEKNSPPSTILKGLK